MKMTLVKRKWYKDILDNEESKNIIKA